LKKIRLPFKIKLLFSPRERRQQIVGAGPRLISYHASAYVTSGEIIKVYNTGYENMATVYIVDEGGRGLYIVDEPRVPEEVKNVYGLIMEHLSYSLKPAQVSNIEDYVKNLVWEAAEELGVVDIVEQHIKTLNYYIMRDVIGYGYIDVPMRDPLVEEISMEGPGVPVAIVHRDVSNYTWLDTNIVIPSEEEAAVFVQKLAQKCGKYISTAFPILEARSPEGHRIALALGEVSGRGSSFTIRKFPEKPLTITQLIDYGTLSPLMAAYFWILLENLAFILIIGGMATGKTTTLQALLTLGPPDYKYVTIEDTPELRLPHTHWDPLYTRKGYTIGSSQLDIDLFELTKFSLRRRGQYIVVGEVRGKEIQSLVQAAATGQGSMCTFHANSIEEAFLRITSPPLDVKPAFLMLIWSIVLMRRVRLKDGRVVRRMAKVWEITGLDLESNKPIPLNYTEVFSWDPFTDSFKPDTPEEVISRSYRLKQVAKASGLASNELLEEIRIRARYLEEMVKDKVFDYNDVSKRLFKYYKSKIKKN